MINKSNEQILNQLNIDYDIKNESNNEINNNNNNNNDNNGNNNDGNKLNFYDYKTMLMDSIDVDKSVKYTKLYSKTFDAYYNNKINNNNNNSNIDKKRKKLTVFCCTQCGTHLTNSKFIHDRRFTGRTGTAYLFDLVYNVNRGPKQERHLKTGKHSVSDVFCLQCSTNLGWYYNDASDDSQKYKIGKFCLELSLIELYYEYLNNKTRNFNSSSLLPKLNNNNNDMIYKINEAKIIYKSQKKISPNKKIKTWLPDYMIDSDDDTDTNDIQISNNNNNNNIDSNMDDSKDINSDDIGSHSSFDSNDPLRDDDGNDDDYDDDDDDDCDDDCDDDDDGNNENSLSVSQQGTTQSHSHTHSQSQSISHTRSRTASMDNDNNNDDDNKNNIVNEINIVNDLNNNRRRVRLLLNRPDNIDNNDDDNDQDYHDID